MNSEKTAPSERVILGVTGSVAAYKAPFLLRELQRGGAQVRVVLSQSAAKLVGPATFSALTGEATYLGLWDQPGEAHVDLAHWATRCVVAPATAQVLFSLAHGGAMSLLEATVLCSSAPLFIAPAMHPAMWKAAAVQRNVALLRERDAHFVGPEEGEVASGEVGVGRMTEPETIASAVLSTASDKSLRGLRVLVTAGPTQESIDPVRFISNRSSGRMGYALARAAMSKGADVTLITGPTALTPPHGARVVPIQSAQEMRQHLLTSFPEYHLLLMSAAVADYRPHACASQKVKRVASTVSLELEANPDLIREVAEARQKLNRPGPQLVAFALETSDLVANARKKLAEKAVDAVVANLAADALEKESTRITLVTSKEAISLTGAKDDVASQLLEHLRDRLLVTR